VIAPERGLGRMRAVTRATATLREPLLRLILPAAGAAVVGAAIGASSRQAGIVVAGLIAVGFLVAVPLSWAVSLSLAASLVFRLATPNETGILSIVPDVMIAMVVVRSVANVARRGRVGLPNAIRWMLYPLAALGVISVVSVMVNRDQAIALLYSLRQFYRYPLWAVAASMAGLEPRDARTIVRVVLAGSLLQFPVAFIQYRIWGAGDPVSGTFGHGGSGVMMVFLVVAAALWLAMALERAIPWWSLWFVGPALVLPMGWGSAATFVVLLPVAVLAVFLRFSVVRHGRLRAEVILAALFILAIGAWTARSYAVAPPCAGCRAQSATQLFHDKYLSQYYRTSLSQGPISRLGFLAFAIREDQRSGLSGELFGQGPSASFIGQASTGGLKLALSEFAAQAPNSVESLQRFLLGYGFLATALYLLLIVIPVLPFLARRKWPEGAGARGLIVSLPVAALIVLLAGPYTGSWTAPGVTAVFWGLVVAAHVGSAKAVTAEEDPG
jgi:hypothetical protein